MAEKSGGSNWTKWVIIIGGIILLLFGVLAAIFVFFLPSSIMDEEGVPIALDIPEIVMRSSVVVGVFFVGGVVVVGALFVVWEFFFKKKEIHIVQEHAKIIKEAAALNPSSTLGMLVMTGRSKIQSYFVGKIVGHTQVPVKFERMVVLDDNGKEDTKLSESDEEYEERKKHAEEAGNDRYDFFAFITGKGVYALPVFNLLEPPKIFACYPSERSPDLVGDVEVFDVGVWKYYGIFVPANRAREPTVTLEDMKNQILPIAITSIVDYVGLVAQRGIEGDTALQKWLEVKSTQVNVKQKE